MFLFSSLEVPSSEEKTLYLIYRDVGLALLAWRVVPGAVGCVAAGP